MKKIRNVMVVSGIMIALIPMVLFYTSHIYYGIKFSLATASIAILCFLTATILQYFHHKKQGYPTAGSIVIGAGFIFLLIYINFAI